MGNSPLVPLHWTKINDESTAKPADLVYEDEQTGQLYVQGQVPGNTTVQEIANHYKVTVDDVTFPLKKKR